MDDTALIDSIYECSLLPSLWPETLDKLARILDARGGVLLAGHPRGLNWKASIRLQDVMETLSDNLMLRFCHRHARVVSMRHSGFLRESDIYSDEAEMGRDPLYRDFLWPAGLGSSIGTTAELPTGDTLILWLERDRNLGPVTEENFGRLEALRGHIARSALLSARLQLQHAGVAADTLALIGLPTMVLDRGGLVLAANRLVQELNHVAWASGNRVVLKDRNADKLLKEAIVTLETPNMSPRSFVVRREDEGPALVAHVVPLRGLTRDLFARSAAILLLTPVTMPQAPPVELVQSLFDLTAAEAQVARRISAGHTIQEIADAGHVTAHTVRSQLREVMSKTGCHRQAEIAALLGGMIVPSTSGEN